MKLNDIIDDFLQRQGQKVPAFIKIKEFVNHISLRGLEGRSFVFKGDCSQGVCAQAS